MPGFGDEIRRQFNERRARATPPLSKGHREERQRHEQEAREQEEAEREREREAHEAGERALRQGQADLGARGNPWGAP
jgi:hypothetical protein